MPWKSALAVLAKAPELGFKLSTAADLGRQLIAEKIHPWQKVRRRTYQSVLAFDIFMNYLDRTRPDMATFFTNHVASSMHRYWAALFPGDYEQCEFTTEWKNTYRHKKSTSQWEGSIISSPGSFILPTKTPSIRFGSQPAWDRLQPGADHANRNSTVSIPGSLWPLWASGPMNGRRGRPCSPNATW